jgi:hypothetical protein
LAALHEDLISDAQAERLATLLRDDLDARRTYIHRMVLVAGLHDGVVGQAVRRDQSSRAFSRQASFTVHSCDDPASAAPDQPSSIHRSSFIIPHISPSAWFSYAVASLVLAIGMFAASAWQVPERGTQLASGVRPTPITLAQSRKTAAGKFTRLVDCRWTSRHGAEDAVAGKIELAGGLLEVTYNNGARAMIEGPATYFLDADDGGTLLRGKLTVCLDAVDARPRASGSRARDLGALVDVAPFAVRLPTGRANVLTGQFTVSVDREGISHMTVSRGAVELLYPGDSLAISDTISSPGQASAYVVRGDKKYPHRLVWRAGPIPEMVQSIIRSEPRTERLGGQPLNLRDWPAGNGAEQLRPTGMP